MLPVRDIQTALEGNNLPCLYLAHHELISIFTVKAVISMLLPKFQQT